MLISIFEIKYKKGDLVYIQRLERVFLKTKKKLKYIQKNLDAKH